MAVNARQGNRERRQGAGSGSTAEPSQISSGAARSRGPDIPFPDIAFYPGDTVAALAYQAAG